MNNAPKTSLNQWNALKADDNRMLIVDDDAINRELLDLIFSSFYTTEHAANGREALTALLAAPQKYCALLLDVVMPEMSGMAVLHAMASRGLTQKIPVFLITGDASDTVINAAYELGVMDVISKPIMSRVVQRRINSVVELFRAREALSSKV
ncbi:response regulator [uncultured Desulfovibrio sp.]|uniref:response regulator n=1 Tax=uncultured Desulfovibrio sp. TaxID=167968 RepID=UPI00261AA7E9|nr:response regulator [uncultured Desulfovibrio sp.]